MSISNMQGGTVGSLCTGYGGLDLAVEAIFDARMVWCAEFDKHASKVIEARFPGVPNLGDITQIDWSAVEPVTVMTAGYPCQPFSHAGKRGGENDTRHIWPHIRDAVRVLRPRLVVLENVAGHLSLGLGRVLGDLAEVGFDARWGCVRSADAGAPHGRLRVFIVAEPADADSVGGHWAGSVGTGGGLSLRSAIDANTDRGRRAWPAEPVKGVLGPGEHGDGPVTLLPTPDASAHKYRLGGGSQQSHSLEARARRGELTTPPNTYSPRPQRPSRGEARSDRESGPTAASDRGDA